MPLSSSPFLLLAADTVPVGGYVSIWKCGVLLVIVLIWARLLTWTDKDAEAAHLARSSLNTGFLAGMVLALALFFILPVNFFIALAALLAIMIVEVAVYLSLRNQRVGLADLKAQFRDWIASFSKGKVKSSKAAAGDVMLSGKHPLELPEGENVQAEIAGYNAIQQILTDPLRRRADRIEVVAGDARSSTRFFVDGFPYEGFAVGKAEGSKAIELLKGAMALDVSDRRKPQSGTMKAAIDGAKHELKILTAGSTAGEQMVIDVDTKKRYEIKLDQLGFSDDQVKTIRESITDCQGIVLLAMPKGQGLTTLEYAMLKAHDAFLTHIQTVERAPEIELEGITQNALPAGASAADEFKQVDWVVSQEPEVIMISRVEDPRSAAAMVKFTTAEGRRAYVGLRAGTTFDALSAWRKLVGDDKLAMKNLQLIIAGRVVRRLCEACKVDYTPDPDTLRKLNISPDRVGKLFTARTTPLKDSRGHDVVCDFCKDMRFRGRIGIYELFGVDDEVRTTVAQGGTVNQLKMLFKKQKRRYLQEQALATAVAGLTSLQEVARVMKATSESSGSTRSNPPTSGGGGGGGGSPSRPPSGSPSRPPTSSSARRSSPPAPRAE